MLYSKSVELLTGLSILAGLVHVLAPDHWVPSSVIAWQRGWRGTQASAFTAFALGLHLLGGLILYRMALGYLVLIPAHRLWNFSALLIVSMCTIRSLRFSRVREVLRLGPGSAWGIFAVFSLLGPCEFLIPILMKARQLGAGALIPFAAFTFGTLISGIIMTSFGQRLWNRPQALPETLYWANQKISVIPAAATVLVGLAFLF